MNKTGPRPASRAFDHVVILTTPIVAFLALRLPPISQNNFTDAMYYLGYANNFADLVDRYGFIYYTVRFGPIFAEMASAQLFGPLAGFHVLRYLLATAVGYALYAVLAERYGRRWALFGVFAWSFNPVTARILLSSYVDSTVVPFTLLGMLVLLREHGRPLPAAFLAGVLMCAGVSGNVFAGVMIALGLPAYALLNWHRPFAAVVRQLLTVLAGSIVTLVVFTWVYDRLFGVTSLWQPAFDISRRLAGGEAKLWTRPAREWLIDSPHNYAPFLILAGTLAVWRWTRDRLALAAAVYLSLLILFYWVSDLMFGGYSLSFYPYFSYWQAALMLGIGVVACQAVRLSPRSPARTAAWMGLSLVGPATLCGLAGLGPLPFGGLVMVAAASLLLFLASLGWSDLRSYALVGCVAGTSVLLAASPVYNAMLGKATSNDRELVKAALQLIDVVPRIADDGKEVAFWYSADHQHRLAMVQSIYLPFSRLRRPDQSFVELGELSAGDAELLMNPQLGHLVIMDFSAERVDRGLAELSRLRIPHRLAQRVTLGSKRFSLAMAHVILDHPPDPLVAALPATVLKAGHGATIRYDAEGATLITGPVIRNWDGILDLTGRTRPGVPVTATITLQVLRGRAGLAWIRPGRPDRVLQENLAPQTRHPIEVSVRAVDGAEPAILALRNWMEDGTRAVIRIRSVTVRQPGDSVAPRP